MAISEGSPVGLAPYVLPGILTAVAAPPARGRGRLAPGVTGPPWGGRGFLGQAAAFVQGGIFTHVLGERVLGARAE